MTVLKIKGGSAPRNQSKFAVDFLFFLLAAFLIPEQIGVVCGADDRWRCPECYRHFDAVECALESFAPEEPAQRDDPLGEAVDVIVADAAGLNVSLKGVLCCLICCLRVGDALEWKNRLLALAFQPPGMGQNVLRRSFAEPKWVEGNERASVTHGVVPHFPRFAELLRVVNEQAGAAALKFGFLVSLDFTHRCIKSQAFFAFRASPAAKASEDRSQGRYFGNTKNAGGSRRELIIITLPNPPLA